MLMTNEKVYYRCPDCMAPMFEETHRSINQHSGGLSVNTFVVCTKCGQKRDVDWNKIHYPSQRINEN